MADRKRRNTEEKPDITQNVTGVSEKILQAKKQEVGKISVRIDRRTWILIHPEKNTPEYLQKVKERMSKIV